jgi:single-stranded DNA-binding protein
LPKLLWELLKKLILWVEEKCFAWGENARRLTEAGISPGDVLVIFGRRRPHVWTDTAGQERKDSIIDVIHCGKDVCVGPIRVHVEEMENGGWS